MLGKFQKQLQDELAAIKDAGLYKKERIITNSQGASIRVSTGEEVLNFCANNYLGLSSHPEVIQAAKDALDTHGYGMSSVRFICGTQDIHKNLEEKLSNFLGTEDTILYAAAFDANGGVFEPLFSAEDAIISDELNHASIIDGAIQEDDVNKKYVKGQAARNELKLKFQVDLVYDCEFYYRAKLEERKKVMAKGIIGVSMADLPRLDEKVAMYPISMNYASRGATHLFLGNLKEAELDLRESINTESKKNRFSKISKQTALLALVLEEQGRIEEAKELYSQIYAETEDLDAAVFRALADKNSTTNSRRQSTNIRTTKRESKKEEVKNTTDLKKLFKLEDKKKNN